MPDDSWKVQFVNLDQTMAQLSRLNGEGPAAVAASLYGMAEQIMTRAKELCPVDTGALRSSGHVLQPETVGAEVGVTLGFGGPAGSGNQGGSNENHVGYAVPQHERLDYEHTVGQAKFLETPIAEAQPQIDKTLAEDLQRVIDRTVRG